MKTTNRLIGLFAAILTTATLMAEVVYEPLVVDSGFNRDCIAEDMPVHDHAVSYLYGAGSTKYGSTYSMATTSVINAVNSGQVKAGYLTKTDSIMASSTGWPDDHDTIRCIEDANKNPKFKNVIWYLAPYDTVNALCLRPDTDPDDVEQGLSNQGKGTVKFKKVGCYQKLYFLIVSPKIGTGCTQDGNARGVHAQVHYTDGTSSPIIYFASIGLGGQDSTRVCKTNIYEGVYKKNTNKDSGKAYACAYEFSINTTKLIKSIEFENKKNCTGSIILGITGMTADMEIPEEESMTVSDIDKTEFRACWDAITEAASYRIDVATDIDFQHILEDYNNLPVSGSTCQDIVNLVSNTDYYWRVRAVNSDGGQSASSSPHRVTTAPDPEKGDTPPYTDETYTNIEENLAQYIGTKSTLAEIDIHRTLYRDGAFNTLCLPFDLNAEEIAASPLVGAQVYEFEHAEKNPSGHLDIEISGPIDHITAGVPYLVKWNPTLPVIIGDEDGDGVGVLVFKNVNVVTNHGQTLGGEDEVKFVGNIGIAHLVEEEQLGLDHNKLFLGAENTLYWPQYNTNLKGFRAYFLVPNDGPSGAPKNTPARIIERHETATGMEIVESQKSKVESKKLIRDNQLYILHNGTMYNVQGQEVKR